MYEKMIKKHVPFLFICLLMFSFLAVKVDSAEPPLAAGGYSDSLYWDVYASSEVQIGEEFSVIFSFRPTSTLDVDRINVTLYGVIGGSWDEWKDSWSNMQMYFDATYTKTAYFTAEKEGRIYGDIVAVYDDVWGERHTLTANFGLTQIIPAKTYQELESDYNLLNQSYLTLQENYDSLEINLKNIQTMIYAFMITTVVFIATTVYFAVRKPKVKTS